MYSLSYTISNYDTDHLEKIILKFKRNHLQINGLIWLQADVTVTVVQCDLHTVVQLKSSWLSLGANFNLDLKWIPYITSLPYMTYYFTVMVTSINVVREYWKNHEIALIWAVYKTVVKPPRFLISYNNQTLIISLSIKSSLSTWYISLSSSI